MKKYLKIIIIVLGLTVVLTIVSLFLSNVYKEKRYEKIKQENEIMDKIDSEYKIFELSIDEHNKNIDDITNTISDYISFYQSIYKNYSIMEKTLKEYENLIKNIDSSSEELKQLCKKPVFRKKIIIEKCNSFNEAYEKVINYFISNVDVVNDKIDEYNNWLNDKSVSSINKSKLKEIKKFDYSSYTYVDINSDGIYSGKVEQE